MRFKIPEIVRTERNAIEKVNEKRSNAMVKSLTRIKRHKRQNPDDELVSIMQDRLIDPIAK